MAHYREAVARIKTALRHATEVQNIRVNTSVQPCTIELDVVGSPSVLRTHTRGIRQIADSIAKEYKLGIKINFPSIHTIVRRHILPYACHGLTITTQVPTCDRTAILYATEHECRDLTQQLGRVFHESNKADRVCAIATGGIPILHYLIARYCWAQWQCRWPSDSGQLAECTSRFHLLCGFRSGWGANAKNHGVDAVESLFRASHDKYVMIVDTTYTGSGIATLLKVVTAALKRATPKKVTIVAVQDRSRGGMTAVVPVIPRSLPCPVDLQWIPTERILTEDIKSAIGYTLVSERRLEPSRSQGMLIIRTSEKEGHAFSVGSLAEFASGLIDSPRRQFRQSPWTIQQIDNQLRVLLSTSRLTNRDRRLLDGYLAGHVDCFALSEQVRSQSAHHGAIVTVAHDPLSLQQIVNRFLSWSKA